MANTKEDGTLTLMAFVRRTGVVSGAMIAVVSLAQILGGMIFQQAMRPIAQEIGRQVTEERQARVKADAELTNSLRQLSSDRIAIIALLEEPAGPNRARRIRAIREAWERQ